MEEQNKTTEEENQPAASAGCWRRFRQWIHCFCVVTFDLELGQTIEVVYPGDAALSVQERSDLCYAAFPDSNSTPPSSHGSNMIPNKGHLSLKQGPSDSMHHFRIRRTPLGEHNVTSSSSRSPLEELVPTSLRPDPRFLNGFSYFRQQRDPILPRGYFQKSIVLVSALPFVALFQSVLAEVALTFFTSGESAIETVCLQIDRYWPPPTSVGHPLLLPLFGLRFQCVIPRAANSGSDGLLPMYVTFYNNDDNNNNRTNVKCCSAIRLNSVHETDQHFHDGIKRLLPHLHLIWELVLLGEPLLALAPTAALSSALVNALVNIISPLRYCGDYRPFFTIHDSDFIELSARQNCCVNNFVLGVTNPFFLKAFAHWPHILKMCHHQFNDNNRSLHRRQHSSDSKEGYRVDEPYYECGSGGEGWHNGQREVDLRLRTTTTIKRLSGRAQLDHRSAGGFLSSHRQFLFHDKLLSRKLLKAPNDSASQWHILRQHFVELTQSFIIPLERYIASLLPLRRHLCPFQPVPPMRPFSLEHFLSTLQHFGHPGVRGDWQGLYRQFVARSPNFIGWLQQRRREIEWQLREEHLEVLCTANFSPDVLRCRNQVEIVDLVLKLRDRLSELKGHQKQEEEPHQDKSMRERGMSISPIKKQPSIVDRQRVQLQQQLNCLLRSVDDELKNLLMSNNTLRRAAAAASNDKSDL